MPFTQFIGHESAPVSYVMTFVGQDWVAGIIDIGAILGMTTVMLVMLYGQIRIGFSMSRDGLLFKRFSTIHPKYRTPYGATWFYGIFCALLGAFVPLGQLVELVNLGTLTAFIIISIAVIVLRYKQPEIERKFRCPGVPYVPALAILFCGFLMFQLPVESWIRFGVWLVIGMAFYFAYSYRNSKLNTSTSEVKKRG
jgi:APA family basic amino acid/polyamine antiporter